MHGAIKLCLAGLAVIIVGGAGETPRPVRVTVVRFAPSGAARTFSGSVQPRTPASLSFQVGGKVIKRPVDVGNQVRAGQVLAQLDLADLQLSEAMVESQLQAAIADAAGARIDLARYERLGHRSAAYLPSEYDKRVIASRVADARLEQMTRQLALARDQRNYGVLTAEADGVVTSLPVQVGQVVTAGQTVAVLAHTAEIEVAMDVPENRLNEVRAANGVTLSVWAAPGTVLHGKVREIGALADPASRTFAVRVSVLDAPPGLLAFGMTATVSLTDGTPVATLPGTALTDLNGRPAVWVFDPARHRASLRPVDLADFEGNGSMHVRAGLSAGEQVVTAGVGQIEPEMALTAWEGTTR